MSNQSRLDIYTDGAASACGRAAIGIRILGDDGEEILASAAPVGLGTSNEAEYWALLFAAEMAPAFSPSHVTFYTDSQLIVRQLVEGYPCRTSRLKMLYLRARKALVKLPSWEMLWIPRAENREADQLARQALTAMCALEPLP